MRRAQSSNSRRGASLVYFMILIPVATTLILVTMTRSEIGLREAQREQNRAQALLLAESALALWRGAGTPSLQTQTLGDAGECRLEIEGGKTVIAVGRRRDRDLEYICTIRGVIDSGGMTFLIIDKQISVRKL